MNRFAEKIALVTGGTRGIGRAIVESMASEGARVFFTGTNAERAAAAAAEIAEVCKVPQDNVVGLALDVRDVNAVDGCVKSVLDACGKIDVLVNNAGVTRDMLIMRMSDEQWNEVIDTDLKGVFNCMRAVARPMLKARYGRIVNISSVVAMIGNMGQCNYAAAKAGVIGLTRAAALEFASRGITVNAVAPGFVETDMTQKLSDAIRAGFVARIPLGRGASVNDIAKTVCFLASDDAAYITGQCIGVNGGMEMS